MADCGGAGSTVFWRSPQSFFTLHLYAGRVLCDKGSGWHTVITDGLLVTLLVNVLFHSCSFLFILVSFLFDSCFILVPLLISLLFVYVWMVQDFYHHETGVTTASRSRDRAPPSLHASLRYFHLRPSPEATRNVSLGNVSMMCMSECPAVMVHMNNSQKVRLSSEVLAQSSKQTFRDETRSLRDQRHVQGFERKAIAVSRSGDPQR